MVKRIFITNRENAKRFTFSPHNFSSIIISITDVQSEDNYFGHLIDNNVKAILRLKFNDVEIGGNNCITEADANKIANFVENWQDKVDAIIVHCEAGISRSAGVAAAISKYIFGNDNEIFDSPKYIPNRTCYRFVYKAFCKHD